MTASRPALRTALVLLALTTACGGDGNVGPGEVVTCEGITTAETTGRIRIQAGQDQCAPSGAPLPTTLRVRVVDAGGSAVSGAWVVWTAAAGSGGLSADSTATDAEGRASANWTLGAGVGGQFVTATVSGVPDTALFHATAQGSFQVLGGGNNVPDRCASDLWVHGSYAYTGTWGDCGELGRVLYVWNVAGAITLVDSIVHAGVVTISDVEVSADGTLLLVTAESGNAAANGLYLYSLADPADPSPIGFEPVARGLHTGTFAEIDGLRYAFASRNPKGFASGVPLAALVGFRIQPDSADPIVQVSAVEQPENYGIHDQYYRDGLVFASVWNTGLRIYDVDGVAAGGTPGAPQLVGQVVTVDGGVGCNCVHNVWWYHDTAGGQRYAFVGQEGPSTVTASSSGDIHVVDVSNLSVPVEVASFRMAGAGVHNFWMDESRGILYAAYYDGGVLALDVTGTLSGDLASREIARVTPGGSSGTYVWGVMLANGALWATDMLSGFWKLGVP